LAPDLHSSRFPGEAFGCLNCPLKTQGTQLIVEWVHPRN